MHNWLDALNACNANDSPCVLVTIIGSEGSMPRSIGTKMLVTEIATVGSIGGSHMEFEAICFARKLLNSTETAITHFFAAHGEDTHNNRSRVHLLFEPFRTNDFNIILFGAGHVGRALVHILSPLQCRITWVDSRAGIFAGQLPSNVHTILNETPEAEVAKTRPGSFFLLTSHSHEQDFRIGEAILKRNDFRYFGMIGSIQKRQQFEQRMLGLGITRDRLQQCLVCPMGLSGISGRYPAEIGIAIAAQLLLIWSQAKGAKTSVGHSDHAS